MKTIPASVDKCFTIENFMKSKGEKLFSKFVFMWTAVELI